MDKEIEKAINNAEKLSFEADETRQHLWEKLLEGRRLPKTVQIVGVVVESTGDTALVELVRGTRRLTVKVNCRRLFYFIK